MAHPAEEWLEQVRGLDVEVCSRMGVQYITNKAGNPSIKIPYMEGGAVYGHKLRDTVDKRFMFHPSGVVHRLFNVDVLDDDTLADQPIIITEGELDTLSVLQSGFIRVVSIPDGWTDGLEGGDGAKVRPLLDREKQIRKSPCVVVAGDNDSTGQSFVRAVANIFDGHPVKYCKWPDDCKDPNDVLRKHGEAELSRCINAAKYMDPPGGQITGFSDLPPMPQNEILRCGVGFLEKSLAFEIGTMSVATGSPGAGKSTFTRYATTQVVRSHGIRVGHMAFETHPYVTREHLTRLHIGQSYSYLKGKERDDLEAMLDAHYRVVHRNFDTGTTHNLGWVESMVRALAVRDQCKIIVIDPWNELEHLPEPGEQMTNYINFALMRIRQMAERFDTHICVVAHPKKPKDGGEYKFAPTGYDVADSAAFYNKPSLGFTVHRPQTAGEDSIELLTWKVRDSQRYGFSRGKIEMDFDQTSMVYRSRMR